MRVFWPVALLFPFLVGCPPSVISAYDEARLRALAEPNPIPANWKPDAIIILSPKLLDETVTTMVDSQGTLQGRFQIAGPFNVKGAVEPHFEVEQLTVRGSDRCERCLAVTTRLIGHVLWSLGPASGEVPVQGQAQFDTEFQAVAAEPGRWTLQVAPREVRAADVTVAGMTASTARIIQTGLVGWAKDSLLSEVPPFVMGTVGTGEVPIRAISLEPAGNGVRVAMLTGAPAPGTLGELASPNVRDGFQLDVSDGTLLSFARRAAFEQGEVGYGVVVEPTRLEFYKDSFTLGMRLWRIRGRGWWRDYVTTGTVAIEEGGIHLVPSAVTEGERSPGAAFVDPLAALGEGFILKTIERAIGMTMPATQTATKGEIGAVVEIEGLTGVSGSVSVAGDLQLIPPARSDR